MRLNLYEKIKIYWLPFITISVLPIIVLYVVFLSAEAASSSGPGNNAVTELPLHYGVGTGYGYSVSDSELQAAIDLVLQNYQRLAGGSNEQVQWIYMYEEGNGYLKLGATRGSCFLNQNSGSTYPNFNYISSCSYNNYNVSGSGYRFLIQNGSISLIWDGYNFADVSTWVEATPTGGSMQKKNQFCFGFPVWSYDNQSIQTTGGQDLLVYGSPGGGSITDWDAPGFGEGTFTVDPSTGDPSGFSFDLNIDFSAIGNKLDALSESLGDWFEPIHDKLDSVLDKLDDILSSVNLIAECLSGYSTNPDNYTGASDFLIDNYIKNVPWIKSWIDAGDAGKEFFETLFDDSSFENPSFDDDFPRVEYEAYWNMPTNTDMEEHPEYDGWDVPIKFVADFSWYERIREPFLTVFGTFFIVGFCFYCFRQIPNILHGVGAGASSGNSVADMFAANDAAVAKANSKNSKKG